MNINAEQKKMYFTETALALNREGFHAETILGGTLGVWLDDEPLCEVGEVGGITYRGENISTPERVAAKDKAYRIVSTTAEYMKQMEQAPLLKAVGLEDQYKLLAEFNGTVFAGMYSRYGVQFVTWERDHDGTGLVCLSFSTIQHCASWQGIRCIVFLPQRISHVLFIRDNIANSR